MYGVIYWFDDNTLFAIVNKNKTLKLFQTLKEADAFTNRWEQIYQKEARVISLEGVKD